MKVSLAETPITSLVRTIHVRGAVQVQKSIELIVSKISSEMQSGLPNYLGKGDFDVTISVSWRKYKPSVELPLEIEK